MSGNVLRRPLIRLLIHFLDDPVQQRVVEIAVIDHSAIDTIGVQLAVSQQKTGDAITIQHPARLQVIHRQQRTGNPFALRTPVFLLADLARAFTANRAVVIGAKRARMQRDHALCGVILDITQQADLRLDLQMIGALRIADGVVAEGIGAQEMVRDAGQVERENGFGGNGILDLDGHKIPRLTRLFQMTGKITRHPQTNHLLIRHDDSLLAMKCSAMAPESSQRIFGVKAGPLFFSSLNGILDRRTTCQRWQVAPIDTAGVHVEADPVIAVVSGLRSHRRYLDLC